MGGGHSCILIGKLACYHFLKITRLFFLTYTVLIVLRKLSKQFECNYEPMDLEEFIETGRLSVIQMNQLVNV